MRKQCALLAASFAVVLGMGSLPQAAASPAGKSRDEPDVRSNAVLVIDESNSSVIFARRAELVTPIASITSTAAAMAM